MGTRGRSTSESINTDQIPSPLLMGAMSKLLDDKFDEKLEPVKAALARVEHNVHIAEQLATDAIQRVTVAENDVADIKQELRESKEEVKHLKAKIISIDNYSRRDCLKIYGVAEKERENCTVRAQEIFMDMGVMDGQRIMLTRAHRQGAYQKPQAAVSGTRSGARARRSWDVRRPTTATTHGS